MTGSTVAVASERQIARPLDVLARLIKEDLQDAKDAADVAAKPYYQAAGEKLLEAKGQISSATEFYSWAHRHFGIKETQVKLYIKYSNATENTVAAARFPSLENFQREHLGYNRSKVTTQPWHEPVKEALNKVDVATLNIRQDELKRAEARLAKRQLMLQLVDIGYKALATKLHPDKGGSREAMARLNEVRKELKDFANR